MPDETPNTPPADQPPADSKPPKATEPTKGKRYAAYDATLLRFVGPVVESKADAGKSEQAKAAKDAGHNIEIREV